MVTVRLEKVSIQYLAPKERKMSLKEYLLRHFLRSSTTRITKIEAIRNLSLEIQDGERVGIIGHNGAGKSTLLKLICGIYSPTTGKIQVEGRIADMLSLGLGQNPLASGWTNIELLSYFQGAKPKEVKRKIKEIGEFTELGEFLDFPVRTYSSGMLARLCFAVATSVDPEILVLDEFMAAGDLQFQKKAQDRLLSLIEKTRLLVFASHDLNLLKSCCNRIIWLKNGQLKYDGLPKEVIHAYVAEMSENPKLVA